MIIAAFVTFRTIENANMTTYSEPILLRMPLFAPQFGEIDKNQYISARNGRPARKVGHGLMHQRKGLVVTKLITIEAGNLSAAVDPMGAQLCSLQLEGREYLWQGDPTFWARHAPVLFPIVGSLRGGRADSAAGPCTMGRHGVARNYVHTVVDRAPDGSAVTFELHDNAETLAAYPYHFKLNITYAITGAATLSQTFRVTNTGDVSLPFCVGGHPAFNVPLPATGTCAAPESGRGADTASAKRTAGTGQTQASSESCNAANNPTSETFDDYVLKFSKPWTCTVPVIGEDGLMSWDNAFACPQANDTIALTHATFAHDALMFTNVPDRTLTLLGTKSGHGVRVDFPGFDYIGVWSAAHDAPFVALEPWTGHTTERDADDVFEHKPGMTLLAPGETNTHAFSITLF